MLCGHRGRTAALAVGPHSNGHELKRSDDAEIDARDSDRCRGSGGAANQPWRDRAALHPASRSARPRSDLDQRLHHPQSRLHGFRHSIRRRRHVSVPAGMVERWEISPDELVYTFSLPRFWLRLSEAVAVADAAGRWWKADPC